MTAAESAFALIEEYNTEAYRKAVEFAVVAVEIGDAVGARLFAGAAIELMRRGYHHYPRVKEETVAAGYQEHSLRGADREDHRADGR